MVWNVPDSVLENEGYKILWDFPTQTDKVTAHSWPDIVCINKRTKSCLIINIAIPGDKNIITKEQEKIDKYQDLRIGLGKLWKLKAEVVPVVVGALATKSHNLNIYIKKIDVPIVTSCLQKTVILGTAFILRVLGISEFR